MLVNKIYRFQVLDIFLETLQPPLLCVQHQMQRVQRPRCPLVKTPPTQCWAHWPPSASGGAVQRPLSVQAQRTFLCPYLMGKHLRQATIQV